MRGARHGRDRAIEGMTHRIPGLRRMPVLKLIALAEIALVARRHLQHLTPAERRRLAHLVSHPRHMSRDDQEELRRLVGTLDARAFAGSTADRLSPVPLPRRFTHARY